MSRKQGGIFAIILVVICILMVILGKQQEQGGLHLPSLSIHHSSSSSDSSPDDSSSEESTQEVEPATATLAVCGDIMSHTPQTNDAYDASTNTYSYMHCFEDITQWLSSADYTVGNLETTLNGPPFSGYPQFCAPDELAYNLKDAGFDLVTTANNHCMDKGFNGVCRTLDVLDQVGLKHVGTFRTQDEYSQNSGVVVADINGISVAFLGYTYGTNGIPISAENDFCVNRFNVDYTGECTTLDEAKLLNELSYAKSLEPDLIAVMIHWGIEYQTTENAYQDTVADFLITNGADIILGSHSHVPQPMMERTVTLADGTQKTGFVCFSLGNFMSNQSPASVGVDYTDTTAILNLELSKDSSGVTTVTKADYVPLLVYNRGASAANRYAILDVHAGMNNYESGQTNLISSAVYQKLQYALNGCHSIMGDQYDYTA